MVIKTTAKTVRQLTVLEQRGEVDIRQHHTNDYEITLLVSSIIKGTSCENRRISTVGCI
jgi:hypothetical protein